VYEHARVRRRWFLSRVWRCVDAPLFRGARSSAPSVGSERATVSVRSFHSLIHSGRRGFRVPARFVRTTAAFGARRRPTTREEKEEKPKAKSGASFVDFQGALGMSRRLVVSFTRALFSAQQAPASPKRLSSPRAFLLSTNEKPKDARERPRASARRRNSPKRTVVTSRYLTSRRRGPDRASRITRVSGPRVSSLSCAPR
jgi:hypothetical protein